MASASSSCAWYSLPCKLGVNLSQYDVNFTLLIGLCVALFAAQQQQQQQQSRQKQQQKAKGNGASQSSTAPSTYSPMPFLAVYALVMGADWLQGPYLYSLYASEHAVAPSLIPSLFTTGFVSGAVAGLFVGTLADRRGRRRACLAFCGCYVASCALTAVVLPEGGRWKDALLVPALFGGRVLGGVATSLLFSAFESWLVADCARKGVAADELSRTFGTMSTVNSVAAIASGVVSEWLVNVSGTRRAPFVASAALLVVAAGLIAALWDENYGDTATKPNGTAKTANGAAPTATTSLRSVLLSPAVLSLGLAGTMFEGSMYLFVFFWTPALQAAQSQSYRGTAPPPLPFGIIFACFMAAMTAASLAFNLVMDSGEPATAGQRRRPRYAHLLLGILGASAAAFHRMSLAGGSSASSSSSYSAEQGVFWIFALFEACVGLYWPCVGVLRGRLVPDGVRAQVYGLLRIPLNVFVVVALLLTREKEGAAAEGDGHGSGGFATVFSVCSKLLLASVVALWAALARRADVP